MSVPNNYEDKLQNNEENKEEDTPKEAVEGGEEYRCSKRNRIANRQCQDYKLCVTVEEQEDRLDLGALHHDALCREENHKKETEKEI